MDLSTKYLPGDAIGQHVGLGENGGCSTGVDEDDMLIIVNQAVVDGWIEVFVAPEGSLPYNWVGANPATQPPTAEKNGKIAIVEKIGLVKPSFWFAMMPSLCLE